MFGKATAHDIKRIAEIYDKIDSSYGYQCEK